MLLALNYHNVACIFFLLPYFILMILWSRLETSTDFKSSREFHEWEIWTLSHENIVPVTHNVSILLDLRYLNTWQRFAITILKYAVPLHGNLLFKKTIPAIVLKRLLMHITESGSIHSCHISRNWIWIICAKGAFSIFSIIKVSPPLLLLIF